jgi:hypothetical protein
LAPQRSPLVARIWARSIWAGRARRNRAFDLARALLAGRRRQPFEILFEIGVLDLREVAAIERIDAHLDLRAERSHPEAVFSSTLLKDAESVADRFAGILILASFDNLLNERILFRRQTDVPSRRLRLATIRIPPMAKIANRCDATPAFKRDSVYRGTGYA